MRIWKNKKGVFAHRFCFLSILLLATMPVYAKGSATKPLNMQGSVAMLEDAPGSGAIPMDAPAPSTLPADSKGAVTKPTDIPPPAPLPTDGLGPATKPLELPIPATLPGPKGAAGKPMDLPLPATPPDLKGAAVKPGELPQPGTLPLDIKGPALKPIEAPVPGMMPMDMKSPPPMPMDMKAPPMRPPSLGGDKGPAARPLARPAGGNGPATTLIPAKRNDFSTDASEVFKVVPQVCTPATGKFIWNFEKEKLINLLRQVSDLLCRTIVINNDVNQNEEMTIIGKSFLTPRDAWDVLLSSMSAKGMSLIEQGKTWMVVKKADSKKFSTPIYTDGNQARDNEGIGTFVYKASHAPLDSLKNIARLLITKDGLVESLGVDSVIVIDTNSNIRRLGGIFSQIDVEDAINKIHFIKLVHADAKTIEKQLRELFDLGSGSRRSRRRKSDSTEAGAILDIEKIISDERTNSLIVVGDKESINKLNETVALMDRADSGEGSKGKIHVKGLRYADAKEVAETLNSVVQQDRGRRRFPRGPGDGTSSTLFEGDVKVTAHEDTNKIVVLATASDFRTLSPTIDALDVRKKQVYVEVVILDVDVSNDTAFGAGIFTGIDANLPGLGSGLGMMANPGGTAIASGVATALTGTGANTDLAGLGNKSIGALAVLGNFLQGGVFGIVGNTGNSQIPTFGAVLKALQTSKNVDVLSTPYLLTTDNKEAEMSVGEKVPVIRGASAVGGAGGGLGIPIQNISHEDVKLTFKVTPHVGADNNVRLDIFQEVNDLGSEEKILNQTQYRIRTKHAKSTIVLKDQQTGVIGGLISHSTLTTDSKIPLLGDIPLLGWLFKSRSGKTERKSLILVITPYVIDNDDDYRKIVDRKMKEREEFARLYYGGKIKNYDPYKDYNKVAGPVSSMIMSLDNEMTKTENGGVGEGDETVITPQKSETEKIPSYMESTTIPPAIEPKKGLAPASEPDIELEPNLHEGDHGILFEVPSTEGGRSSSAVNSGLRKEFEFDNLHGGPTDFFDPSKGVRAANSGG